MFVMNFVSNDIVGEVKEGIEEFRDQIQYKRTEREKNWLSTSGVPIVIRSFYRNSQRHPRRGEKLDLLHPACTKTSTRVFTSPTVAIAEAIFMLSLRLGSTST